MVTMLPPEPAPLSVVLVREQHGHQAGVVYRRYGTPRGGWCPPGADPFERPPVTWAELCARGEVSLLVEQPLDAP